MQVDIKEVKNHNYIYIVTFYDGYIEGKKYDVEKLNTSYIGFYPTVGALYFDDHSEAYEHAEQLNGEH